MIIARAVENERRDALRELAIELFDDPRRCTKTQTRSPFERVDGREIQRLISPCIVEIEMESDAQKRIIWGCEI